MKKSDVNGKNELPLYTYLKSQQGFKGFSDHKYRETLEKMLSANDYNWANISDIKWNFTKFIVDRNGNVVSRLEPMDDLDKMEEKIKEVI